MPKVPSYQPNQVREAPISGQGLNLKVSREDLGGDTRVFQAATQMGQVVDKMRTDADDINVRDADLAAAQLQNKLEQGIRNLRGKNSVGAPELLEKEWQKGMDEIEKTLVNDAQKAKFDAVKKARFITLDSVANRHMGDEMRKHDDMQTTAYVATARDEALANYKDTERVGLSLMQQEKAINEHADRHGVPDDVRKLNLAEAKSKTQYGIISRLVNSGEDLSAQSYFKTVADQLTGVDKAAAEKILEEGSLRGESQRRADAIFGKNAESMQAALEQARNIEEPKLRDEVVSRVKSMFGDKKVAENMDIEDLHRRSTDILDKTPNVDLIPREDWTRFSLSERSALKNYAENRAQGKQPATDYQVYYDLTNMASGPQPLKEKFMRLNLMDMKYRGNLNDSKFEEMAKLQANMRSGKGDTENILDGYRTDASIVNDSLAAVGVNPSPKDGSSDSKKVAQFRAEVDRQIRRLQEETGKKANNEEVQGIVDRMLIQGTVKGSGFGGWFQTKKRIFEAVPGEKLEILPEDIPMSERRKIQDALRSQGIPVTEDNVFKLFQQRALKDVK